MLLNGLVKTSLQPHFHDRSSLALWNRSHLHSFFYKVSLITLEKHEIVLNTRHFPPALCDYLNLLPEQVRSSKVIPDNSHTFSLGYINLRAKYVKNTIRSQFTVVLPPSKLAQFSIMENDKTTQGWISETCERRFLRLPIPDFANHAIHNIYELFSNSSFS